MMPVYNTVFRVMGFRLLKRNNGKYFVKMTNKSKVRRILKDRSKKQSNLTP